VPSTYAGQRRHIRASVQVAASTARQASPHRKAGLRASCTPDRPACSDGSPDEPTVAVAAGAVAVTVGVSAGVDAGAGALGPASRATTMSRWAALYLGVHVVSVSRLSGVASSTDTSFGATIFFSITS